ncbi:putative transcription factor AP2-EREBP family [Rosa chinensis]|uniref:Putative transcription factor AP2-EREBP family n=1 Tax=Rosa chinensis TaxID=74649 RepID=A0A2P6SMW6_ROSCH|nr:ethylene-responsive transcription factor ERF027 [Rosa chinensis]PRQ60027.1 putative transcription factor AP2-EREBP family [Rosa chinensis]
MADPYGNVPKSDDQPSNSNPPFFIQLPPTSSSSDVNDQQHHDLLGLRSPTGGSISSPGRHPLYRGIRCRSGKWVSEIREPRKSNRIWLGTYAKPEMAAAAYDVAAIALKGPDTALNFPNALITYPIPASSAASDIRAAAARAAASRAENIKPGESSSGGAAGRVENVHRSGGGRGTGVTSDDGGGCQEFMDEEALLNMPNLLADMAEGMLVSPPRDPADDSPGNSDGESLWSY